MRIKDRILLGTIAGAAGATAAYLLGAAAKRAGIEQRTWAERAKGLVVSRGKSTKAADAAGLLANEAIGVVAGIPLVYAHTLTGKDKALVKGAVYGGLMWLAVYGLGQRAIGDFRSKPSSSIVNLVANVAYGAVAAAIITKLGDESLFANRGPDTDYFDEALEDPDSNDGAKWAEKNMISARRIEDLH